VDETAGTGARETQIAIRIANPAKVAVQSATEDLKWGLTARKSNRMIKTIV
jgi:hypothetical protein